MNKNVNGNTEASYTVEANPKWYYSGKGLPCDRGVYFDDSVRKWLKEVIKEAIQEIEKPKGHWIAESNYRSNIKGEPIKEKGEFIGSVSCSECGEWLVGSDEYPCSHNFCPNCGADMRGKE